MGSAKERKHQALVGYLGTKLKKEAGLVNPSNFSYDVRKLNLPKGSRAQGARAIGSKGQGPKGSDPLTDGGGGRKRRLVPRMRGLGLDWGPFPPSGCLSPLGPISGLSWDYLGAIPRRPWIGGSWCLGLVPLVTLSWPPFDTLSEDHRGSFAKGRCEGGVPPF